MNSRGCLSQKLIIFMHHTFYRDGTKILHFYDCSTFPPRVALCVLIFSFLSEKIILILTKNKFFETYKKKKTTIWDKKNIKHFGAFGCKKLNLLCSQTNRSTCQIS